MARMLLACCCVVAAVVGMLAPSAGAAVDLPPGFQQRTVFSGLTFPTAVRFAPDGRAFVAEKSGRILAYDGVDDVSPTQVIDLRREVYNYSDRGLLGLAVDPGFPARPYIYALYTRDALPGGNVPHWGSAGGLPYENEDCPDHAATSAACLVSGRLVKITVDPGTNVATGSPQALITDWCSEFLSHSVGDLHFGPDGQLYVSGGDGADYDDVDYGQKYNGCADPANEGGALRSQDLRTSGDPTGLDGAVLRVDPDTGAGSPGNPLAASADANARRIVADGLRNPFRFTVDPTSGDLWLGDVGWGSWEEVNRLPNPAAPGAPKRNFGWPCYEGDALPGSLRQPVYETYGLGICSGLYADGPDAVTPPVYSYFHDKSATDPSLCATARGGPLESFKQGSSVTGMSVYTTGDYGAEYEGGLFFADYTRGCIWFMGRNEDGPDPTKVKVFAERADFPIDLERGPGGDLFYVDIVDGDVQRIQKSTLSVSLSADKTYGAAPLSVQLSATATGNQGALSYTWDLDGDGLYGDGGPSGSVVTKSFAKQTPGVKVRVRVTDAGTGQVTTSKPVLIAAGDVHPPVAQIDSPTAALTWVVGQKIDFAGTGVDPDSEEPGGKTPASRMRWDVIMKHCPGGCHEHFLRSFEGQDAGSFTGIQHEYPSHLTLRLTVTDAYGMTDTTTVDLEPQTVVLCVLSNPSGRAAVANLISGPTPLKTTVIKGSLASVTAQEQQVEAGRSYLFRGWSDGGALSHTVVTDADTTLTASFLATPVFGAQPAITGTPAVGRVLTASDGEPDGGVEVATARRWQRCDGSGGACTDILGADAATYTPVAADTGRRLRFRVDASNAIGSAIATSEATAQVTAPASVTAPAPGPVAAPVPTPAAAPTAPSARRGPSVRAGRDGTVALRVRCAAKARCTGSLLLVRPGVAGRLARASLRIAAGRTITVKLRLSSATRTLLRRTGSLDVQRTLTLKPTGGAARTTLTRFRLLAPRR